MEVVSLSHREIAEIYERNHERPSFTGLPCCIDCLLKHVGGIAVVATLAH